MFKILEFYFKYMAKVVTDIWASWEIFPGVNYAIWILSVALFVVFIQVIKFGVRNPELKAIKASRDRDFKQGLQNGYVGKHQYSPKHGRR